MITGIKRSILLLLPFFLTNHAPVPEDPFAVFDSFRERLSTVSTFSAGMERVRTCRTARRLSRGAVVFDRTRGTLYSYRSPGKYLFFYSGTHAYGVDRIKAEGWRLSDSSRIPSVRLQLDPLFSLFQLYDIDTTNLVYRGSSNTVMFFSHSLVNGHNCTFGIDNRTFRCRIIEAFDRRGNLTGKTGFHYHDRKMEAPVPSTVVIAERVGATVVTDTIIFKRMRLNVALKEGVFAVPKNITWRPLKDGTLLSQQLDPVSDR